MALAPDYDRKERCEGTAHDQAQGDLRAPTRNDGSRFQSGSSFGVTRGGDPWLGEGTGYAECRRALLHQLEVKLSIHGSRARDCETRARRIQDRFLHFDFARVKVQAPGKTPYPQRATSKHDVGKNTVAHAELQSAVGGTGKLSGGETPDFDFVPGVGSAVDPVVVHSFGDLAQGHTLERSSTGIQHWFRCESGAPIAVMFAPHHLAAHVRQMQLTFFEFDLCRDPGSHQIMNHDAVGREFPGGVRSRQKGGADLGCRRQESVPGPFGRIRIQQLIEFVSSNFVGVKIEGYGTGLDGTAKTRE